MSTQKRRPPLRTAEIFAGIGGVTAGFIDAGFRPVFLHDMDRTAHDAFVHNFPEFAKRYFVGDVRRLTAPELIRLAGGHVDGLLGCPPCQGLSPAGPRKKTDKRNELLSDFARLTKGVMPKFFVLENVPSLLGSTVYSKFAAALDRHYRIHAAVVNVAEYGVPQLRRRAVVVGIRRDLGVEPSLPVPTHGGTGRVFDYSTGKYVTSSSAKGRHALQLRPRVRLGRRSLVTLEDALGDLHAAATGEDAKAYSDAPRTSFQRAMRRGRRDVVANHQAWNHEKKIARLLVRTDPGSAPSRYGTPYRNRRYFSQAYARLHRRGLARTITTNFHNPGSGRYAHYGAPRTLTVREALRIQSFPDRFEFDLENMTMTNAERLVGNAFPRRLAAVVARHVSKLLLMAPQASPTASPRPGPSRARRTP